MGTAAAACGLDGIVILNHHYHANEKDVNEVRRATDGRVTAFRGTEITVRIPGDFCDDLLFISPSPCPIAGPIKAMPQWLQFIDYVQSRREHVLVVVAHPYRRRSKVIDAKIIDAIEIASRNTPKDARADILRFATQKGIAPVAASDAHRTRHLGGYCIECHSDAHNESELAELVRNRQFDCLERQLVPMYW